VGGNAGSYSLAKTGGGTLVLSGTLQAGATNAFSSSSAFTIASGTTLGLHSFNRTIGSLAGAGSVTLGSATLTTGNDNMSTTFSGTISGTGGLTKIGAAARWCCRAQIRIPAAPRSRPARSDAGGAAPASAELSRLRPDRKHKGEIVSRQSPFLFVAPV
jgi:hypothetical protein